MPPRSSSRRTSRRDETGVRHSNQTPPAWTSGATKLSASATARLVVWEDDARASPRPSGTRPLPPKSERTLAPRQRSARQRSSARPGRPRVLDELGVDTQGRALPPPTTITAPCGGPTDRYATGLRDRAVGAKVGRVGTGENGKRAEERCVAVRVRRLRVGILQSYPAVASGSMDSGCASTVGDQLGGFSRSDGAILGRVSVTTVTSGTACQFASGIC